MRGRRARKSRRVRTISLDALLALTAVLTLAVLPFADNRFPSTEFVIFLSLIMMIYGTKKRLSALLLLSFSALQLLGGSRSAILQIVILGCITLFVLGIPVRLTKKQFALGMVVGCLAITVFAYATIQRTLKSVYGPAVTVQSIGEAADQVKNLDSWKAIEPMVGLAVARAGILDFSAEIFAQKRFETVINLESVAKSTIDNYIIGDVFQDGRRLAYRLRDIYYGEGATGYQSDAIGVVAENYLLFGYAFPIIIAGVALLFTILFRSCSPTPVGYFLRFLVGMNIMTWWNSYGYDWLFIEFGRQIICGGILVWMIVYAPRLWKYRISTAKA